MAYIDWKDFSRRRFFFIRSAWDVAGREAKGNTLGDRLFASFVLMWAPVYIALDLAVIPFDLLFNCIRFGSREF